MGKIDHSTARAIHAVKNLDKRGRILLISSPATMPDSRIGLTMMQRRPTARTA
jgi:hypothetical protein